MKIKDMNRLPKLLAIEEPTIAESKERLSLLKVIEECPDRIAQRIMVYRFITTDPPKWYQIADWMHLSYADTARMIVTNYLKGIDVKKL